MVVAEPVPEQVGQRPPEDKRLVIVGAPPLSSQAGGGDDHRRPHPRPRVFQIGRRLRRQTHQEALICRVSTGVVMGELGYVSLPLSQPVWGCVPPLGYAGG